MQKFKIELPNGYLIVEEKGNVEDYPGVFISFSKSGEETDYHELIACVEYDSCDEELKTEVYAVDSEEPVHIMRHEDGKDLL